MSDCGCCRPMESNDRCGGCPSCMMERAQAIVRDRADLLTECSILLRRAINGHLTREKATKWLESKGWDANAAALRTFVPSGEPSVTPDAIVERKDS